MSFSDLANPSLLANPSVKLSRPAVRGAGRAGRRTLGLGALLILSGAVGYGSWRHYQVHTEVIATAAQARDFVPTVLTAPVRASAPTLSVIWPASTQAFAAAEIYARATGYIEKRNVDIGDRVKQGDLLAGLAVPDSMTRFPKTKRRSIGSDRRWSRRRPT